MTRRAETIGLIVPVYRVEKFVASTIAALAAQTRRADRVILVDDCGGDDSMAIATDAAERCGLEVEVLTNPRNLGVSAARNAALARLDTDLVWFFDSDDLAEPRMLEELHTALSEHDADIAMSRTALVDSENRMLALDEGPYPDPVVSGREAALRLLRGDLRAYPTNKLLRRDRLGAAPFPIGQAYEDLVVMIRVLLAAQRVALVDAPLLRYRTNTASISRNFGAHTSHLFSQIDEVHQLLVENGVWDEPDTRAAFLRFRYDAVILPCANMALRAADEGRHDSVVTDTVERARSLIRLSDITGLWRRLARRQAIAAAVLKSSPHLYAAILRRR